MTRIVDFEPKELPPIHRPIKIYWCVGVFYGIPHVEGLITVYSTDTMEEAEQLVPTVCTKTGSGGWVYPELIKELSLENIMLFIKRLDEAYKIHIKPKGV